jgi:D-amino-acid dehydrogenase
MSKIAVIGAGISGVTSAYALAEAGHDVVVIDRHRYPAMETSYANGGQLSASNAEVWNSVATMAKALRWIFRRDAPLLINPAPNWHKYSWLAEFVWNIRHHRENTIATVRLAIDARKHLFAIAEREQISFDLERCGILHVFNDKKTFEEGRKTNDLLAMGGLERFPVTPPQIREIEPALTGTYYGGFFTPSDASGDIHKFTRGLASACAAKGVAFVQGASVDACAQAGRGFKIALARSGGDCSDAAKAYDHETIEADKIVVCAGVGSRRIASMLGDRLNVYPVKGYSITVNLDDANSRRAAPNVSLLDEAAKIVTSRLGADRFRVAGTAELNGYNLDIRANRIKPLCAWVRTNFTEVDTSRIVPWAGLRPMMPNMMPVVRAGRRPGVYYNTGHGHLGWTLSAATAALLVPIVNSDRPP